MIKNRRSIAPETRAHCSSNLFSSCASSVRWASLRTAAARRARDCCSDAYVVGDAPMLFVVVVSLPFSVWSPSYSFPLSRADGSGNCATSFSSELVRGSWPYKTRNNNNKILIYVLETGSILVRACDSRGCTHKSDAFTLTISRKNTNIRLICLNSYEKAKWSVMIEQTTMVNISLNLN